MDIEKLVIIWRSQFEAMVGEQGVTPFFDMKNEF